MKYLLPVLAGALFCGAEAEAQPGPTQGYGVPQEYVVVVRKDSPHRAIAELVELGRSAGKELFCGAGHSGSTPGGVMDCERFAKSTGAKVSGVPYKSFKAMTSDLNSGQVDFGVLPIDEAVAMLTSGKVRALAVGVEARTSPIPGTPTLKQAGYR